jgi:DNA polymerase-1
MQGSAADIMKKAMIRVDKRLQEMGFEGGIILQIHDELLLEVEEERCEEAKEMVKFEMENAWRLNVPLIVEIGVGRSWGETH